MLTAILEVSAQYQVSVLNATKDAVSMRCVGYGKKATIASMDAELSAIKTLLFVGTQKTQHSMPLVQEDKAVVENKYKKFFDAFYSKEYQNFVESSIIVTLREKRIKTKMYNIRCLHKSEPIENLS